MGARLLRSCQIALRVFNGIVQPGTVLLEERVNLESRSEAEHTANFRFRKRFVAVTFERQSLEGRSSRILAAGGNLCCKFVRDV